jgi:iron complex transport system substrate-binding protein
MRAPAGYRAGRLYVVAAQASYASGQLDRNGQRAPYNRGVSYPSRIVCLTEETTEILYLLGESDRIVGVSGYTVRPIEARAKPRISSFLHARSDKIEALEPDLVLAFSDLQADIVAGLIRKGYPVMTFNQRSVAEVLQAIRLVGSLVGAQQRAEQLADTLRAGLDAIAADAASLPTRPRVFFEEWDAPLISGIQWVEELVEIAGGIPIFPELRRAGLARDRIVAPDEVRARNPDLILASWCGKRVQPSRIAAREGWNTITAVRHGHIHEIKSSLILQPGPAALTDGVHQIAERIRHVAANAGGSQRT